MKRKLIENGLVKGIDNFGNIINIRIITLSVPKYLKINNATDLQENALRGKDRAKRDETRERD